MRFYSLGDAAVTVEVDTVISIEAYHRVQSLMRHTEQHRPEWLTELVPAFTTLTFLYNPLTIPYSRVAVWIEDLLSTIVPTITQDGLDESLKAENSCLKIPVCYEPHYGLDTVEVALFHGLRVEDVICLHTSSEYLVAMVGFTPGFPYLLGLDERLHTPRRATPRLRVPSGSVAIGGAQTGIYPMSTPGGWNIIGCTPLQLFTPHAVAPQSPSLLKAGDRIRFYAVSKEEFRDLS